MDPQQPKYDDGADDTEGHAIRGRADAERDEAEDTEGHAIRVKFADAERDETEDTEGHTIRVRFADGERDETDDVAGHASDSLGARRKTVTDQDH